MNLIDQIILELNKGNVVQARVPGYSQEYRQVVRLGMKRTPSGEASYIACRFSYSFLQNSSYAEISDYQRIETDSLDRASAWAARFNVDFHNFRVEPLNWSRRFYSLDLNWMRELGIREESIRAFDDGAGIEGRGPGPDGFNRVFRLSRMERPDHNIVDPKDDKPAFAFDSLDRKVGTYLDHGDDHLGRRNHIIEYTGDFEEAINRALEIVPNVDCWLDIDLWEDWDRQDGLLHPDS